MPTSSSNYFAILIVAIAGWATACNAFSTMGPSAVVAPSRARLVSFDATSTATAASKLSMTSDVEAVAAEEDAMVTLRTINFIVYSKPLGIVLEELGDGVGVFAAECDLDGAAYAAGIRDGDVLASLDGDETILSATLDDALVLLGQSPTPLPIKVYRELENTTAQGTTAAVSGRGTVKMSPRRLPSTKKLVKASTSANFWKDPLMIGSAVLTVAMPLGIYIASKGM